MTTPKLTWLLAVTAACGFSLALHAHEINSGSQDEGAKATESSLANPDQPVENSEMESTNSETNESSKETSNTDAREERGTRRSGRRHGINRNAIVVIGHDVELKAGDS